MRWRWNLAEREGFEPPLRCRKPDFESGAFDHSATSPVGCREPRILAALISTPAPPQTRKPPLRIPDWTNEAAPRDPALVEAILKRRGGMLINLDKALLWSEPLARGWNAYVGAVRRELAVSPRLK